MTNQTKNRSRYDLFMKLCVICYLLCENQGCLLIVLTRIKFKGTTNQTKNCRKTDFLDEILFVVKLKVVF